MEARLRHRTGEYRWVLSRALPVRDDSGVNGRLIVNWSPLGQTQFNAMLRSARDLLTRYHAGAEFDPLTVEFRTPRVNPVFLQQLGTIFIMNKAWCEKHRVAKPLDFKNKEESFASFNANGTGPYQLVQRQPGISLSQLLAGVSQLVAQSFPAGLWTLVEVLDARLRNGHVYLELSERDASGQLLAKANGMIWASNASRILPEFERATGATLGPGIKLLVRARPVFKPQYGFSLELDAIDSGYTLGDLEARKREIRERLQREGLYARQKQLALPWDYQHLLVIAPEGGAGLGDFQAEAARLQRHGVCRFDYAYSRFQGEGAAAEIRRVLLKALQGRGQGDRPEIGRAHV